MLTERQLFILKAIVDLYEKHGDPIGSRTLIDQMDLDYSSATIRNDMSALEKANFIKKTHSSSGRVPSEEGYRFYIDHLLKDDLNKKSKPASKKFQDIHTYMNQKFRHLDDIVDLSADILSNITSYAAIVLGPTSLETTLASFKIVALHNHQVMAIIVTTQGEVEHLTFSLPEDVDFDQFNRVINYLENQLTGKSLGEVYRLLTNDLFEKNKLKRSTYEWFLKDLIDIFSENKDQHIRMSGLSNLFDFMDGQRPEEMKAVYQLFEQQKNVVDLLTSSPTDFTVRIGEEIENEHFDKFSLVTARYHVEEHGDGVIAIIGPTNMTYDRTIEWVNAFQDILPETIIRFYDTDEK